MTTSLRLSEHVVIEVVDGEAVLLDLQSNEYFALSPTGLEVVRGIEQGMAVEALVERIVSRFEIDAATARADIDAFVADLTRRQIVLGAAASRR